MNVHLLLQIAKEIGDKNVSYRNLKGDTCIQLGGGDTSPELIL